MGRGGGLATVSAVPACSGGDREASSLGARSRRPATPAVFMRPFFRTPAGAGQGAPSLAFAGMERCAHNLRIPAPTPPRSAGPGWGFAAFAARQNFQMTIGER